ncbi:MAG: AAA family ATPase [Terrestrivirus sp.]|uniref:AAA family ATPase n=1 Tax=Terrestrivirus sp. TaxID=2487775 RepID=A0A3G4ZSY6_9VIRU|nr:MAG: AAA family ATPase [Terrestrivirus sp.]
MDPSYQINQALNMSLFNIFKTGNPIVDAIIVSLISVVVINNVSKIFTSLSNISIFSVYYFFLNLYRKIKMYLVKEEKKIIKTVTVSYITDEKKVNELYEPVYFFLTDSQYVDFSVEPSVRYTYDKKFTAETNIEDVINLNKVIGKLTEKTIKFEEHSITYTLSSELITVYGDEERKKENRIITLTTYVSQDEKRDILNEFTLHCVQKYVLNVRRQKWQPTLYQNSGNRWNAKPLKNRRKIDTVILPRETKKDLMDDINFFIDNKDWYHEIGMPYTRGYLLYGKPGCGKTSVIKGISNYCKRNIHYLILNDIASDSDLYTLLTGIDYSSTILVIEDIDCASTITKQRGQNQNKEENNQNNQNNQNNSDEDELKSKKENQNKNQKQGITLSGLLNALDGVNECEGRILIMTTNRPDELDEALIRPGRIDKKYYFDYCSREQIGDIYRLFFNKNCDQELLERINEKTFSPAYIMTQFMQFRNKPDHVIAYLLDPDNHPFNIAEKESEGLIRSNRIVNNQTIFTKDCK